MKTIKFYFTSLLLLFTFCLQAQNLLYIPGSLNTSTNTNVGINYNSPVSELQVMPGIDRTGLGSALGMGYRFAGYLGFNLLYNYSQGTWTSEGNGQVNGASAIMGTIDGDMHFKTYPSSGSGSQHNITNPALLGLTRMFIGTPKGNVGIHTTNPLQTLHVNSRILIDGDQATMLFGGEISGALPWGEYGIEYYDLAGTTFQNQGLNFWKPWGSHNGSGGNGNANWILFLNNDGNIGMGVQPSQIDPAYRLSVCGSIRAKEIKVNTGWCDFVFEKDYILPSINEVEKFINVNKHLPGIPPATEIENNGVELGNIVSKQMQKIEELHLYVINLNKKIEFLESENVKLHERLK